MLLHKCYVKRAGRHVKSAPIWLHEGTMAPEPQAQAMPVVGANRKPGMAPRPMHKAVVPWPALARFAF